MFALFDLNCSTFSSFVSFFQSSLLVCCGIKKKWGTRIIKGHFQSSLLFITLPFIKKNVSKFRKKKNFCWLS